MNRALTTLFALGVVLLGFGFAKPASAATIPLSGYAWTETMGWIHFKNTATPAYGVLVNSSDGSMSGYAWAETYGWLSFNAADTAACGTNASLDVHSGVLSGWAKWLSSGECVHLKGTNYGVTYDSNTNEFSGYAWGDTNTGWMHWKGVGYGVVSDSPIVEPPAAPTNLALSNVTKVAIRITWQDNSSGETGFKIERSANDNAHYTQITITNPNRELYDDSGLTPGTLYYYRVRATNNGGDSIYTNEDSTTTLPYTANITVNVSPSADWTINPGNIQRTGSATVTVNPSGQGTTYTLTPGNAPAGYDFPPTVTNSQGSGSSMALFDNGSASFTVTYTKSLDYSLSNNGVTPTPIQKGGIDQYGTVDITKTLNGGSGPTKAVSLDVSGVPANVDASWDGNRDCSPTCTSRLTFTVHPSAIAGTYPITVTGTPQGSGPTKTTNFNLQITNSPDMLISCSHTGTVQVGQQITWTANLDQPGAGAPYTYIWSGTNVPTSPAPSTQSFTMVYTTTGTKSVQVTVRDRLSNVAVCPAATVNIGVTPNFQEF